MLTVHHVEKDATKIWIAQGLSVVEQGNIHTVAGGKGTAVVIMKKELY